MNKTAAALLFAGALTGYSASIQAAVSADEAKKLGAELTAVGAEKAGNKEGTIPEYTGGLTTPPASFDKSKNVRPDPFASEKPLFSIDAKNMATYADKLSAGTQALMKAIPDFRIDVYPTHRTAAYPKFVLENSVANATRAKISDDGMSSLGARAGIPFPIPKTGNEAMLNHIARYQGISVVLPKYSAYNVDSAGNLTLATQGVWTAESPYYQDKDGGATLVARARANYTGPARRAGEAIMTLEPIDYSSNGRRAWQYLPGQRRVRLAPDLAYDTPNASTGGQSTIDDVNLFSGKLDRYDFKLVGKKELYVPYNDYRFNYSDKPEDVFQAKSINPSAVRWELHRVWVVEASLKEGKRHIYSRRTFYLDEDTWSVTASDQYDGRSQLWRAGFAYPTQMYDRTAPNSMTSGHYDLLAGTYYVNLWPGTSGVKVTDSAQPDSEWTADSLASQGVR
ncbi:DUF1329 domain-containing protein [Variovorax sp. J22R115]|uniref:DUF1329 domain-containing protein n=1 Tax=Variovorax sp. J22R115 TaxID=3053509 RepID=UPI0025769010|nr:DUF1329 domain-containing protein [Variovorax sp. J22R115]MDM0047422.1 DUF1329 domain-containing protein [Variovorax sp. J22R115]